MTIKKRILNIKKQKQRTKDLREGKKKESKVMKAYRNLKVLYRYTLLSEQLTDQHHENKISKGGIRSFP